ncbi:glucosyltransferase domain-containing protein [Lactococcus formosensis]|uniref:Glucosyltransferase domain-containing protein n=1 Tax=Lactococcus formosensis TaxID=1281486 RepID=A0A9Q8Y5S1_9LACT|nr:glucosyltransferase domain-containing protein [Lactococcus formosensis]USJ21604.1 glucosyltransferase domain-containing protein [Lactococcus formosensis]
MLNKKFIISGCLPIVVATIITYFGYFINTYHLDTSIQIASNGMNSMYMSQGRYVVVLLNKILYGNYSLYDNQIVPFITIFILILCGSYLYFLLSNYSDVSSYIVKLCISIFFINNPIIYSQLFFKLQAVQVVLALLILLITQHILLSNMRCSFKIILNILLLIISLLTYQTFAFVYISFVFFWSLINSKLPKNFLIISVVSLSITGILTLTIIQFVSWHYNLTTATSSELYNGWSNLFSGQMTGIYKIKCIVFSILYIISLLSGILLRYKKIINKNTFFLLLLIISLFSFTIVFLDWAAPARVYFASFSIVFSGILFYIYKINNKTLILIIAFTLTNVLLTINTINIINYSGFNDIKIAQNINNEITEVSSGENISDYKIMLIGNTKSGLNKYESLLARVATGNTTASDFSITVSPNFWAISHLLILNSKIGTTYNYTNDDIQREILSLNLHEIYPSKESIKLDKLNKIIVVRLS